MDDENLVVVADHLWPHEAGMMQGLLQTAGIEAYVKGGLSTASEIPGPVSSVTVAAANKDRATEILAGVDSSTEVFVCPQCGETSPPGFTECPMCAVVKTSPKPVPPATGNRTVRTVGLFLVVGLLAYVYFRAPG
jgi:hypothetical protein